MHMVHDLLFFLSKKYQKIQVVSPCHVLKGKYALRAITNNCEMSCMFATAQMLESPANQIQQRLHAQLHSKAMFVCIIKPEGILYHTTQLGETITSTFNLYYSTH